MWSWFVSIEYRDGGNRTVTLSQGEARIVNKFSRCDRLRFHRVSFVKSVSSEERVE
tara:strand:+ start:872 stop:1039 length:168 start_codon:yes stop_codon:yes gene_type:complete